MILLLLVCIFSMVPVIARDAYTDYSLAQLFQAAKDQDRYEHAPWERGNREVILPPTLLPLEYTTNNDDNMTNLVFRDRRLADLDEAVLKEMRHYRYLPVVDRIIIKDSVLKSFDPAVFSRVFPDAVALVLFDNTQLTLRGLYHSAFKVVTIEGSSIPLLKRGMLYLPNVRKLVLVNDGIQALNRHWAETLTELQELDLRDNSIKILQRGWAYGLSNLQKIIIDKDLDQEVKNKMKKDLEYAGINAQIIEE